MKNRIEKSMEGGWAAANDLVRGLVNEIAELCAGGTTKMSSIRRGYSPPPVVVTALNELIRCSWTSVTKRSLHPLLHTCSSILQIDDFYNLSIPSP